MRGSGARFRVSHRRGKRNEPGSVGFYWQGLPLDRGGIGRIAWSRRVPGPRQWIERNLQSQSRLTTRPSVYRLQPSAAFGLCRTGRDGN